MEYWSNGTYFNHLSSHTQFLMHFLCAKLKIDIEKETFSQAELSLFSTHSYCVNTECFLTRLKVSTTEEPRANIFNRNC